MAQPATQALGIQPPPTTTLPTIQVTAPARAQPPAFQMPTSSAGALDLIGNTMAQERAQIAPVVSGMQTQMKADQARVNQAEQAAQPFNPPPAPTPPPELTAAQKFGSLSSIFAIAASAFTRTPMINAMNAMAAGIKARQQNNAAGYAQAYQAWKTNTDIALERHQAQQADLDDALKMLSTNIQKGTAMIQAYSAEYGDTFMAAQLALGHFDKMAELAVTRERIGADLQMAAARLDEAVNKSWTTVNIADPAHPGQMQTVRYNPNTGQATSLDGKTQLTLNGDQLSKISAQGPTAITIPLTPSAVTSAATTYRLTGKLPPGSYYGTANSDLRNQIINAAAAQAVALGQDPAQMFLSWNDEKANQAALLNQQKIASASYGFEYTMQQNMKVAQNLEGAIPGGVSPLINQWVETGEIQAGNSKIQPYAAALATVLDEQAKIMAGATASVAAPTDAARQQVVALLGANSNPATVQGVFDVFNQDVNNRQQGYNVTIQALNQAIASGVSAGGAPDTGGGDLPAISPPSGASGAANESLPAALTGSGTQTSPYDLSSAPDPNAAFNALPSGAYFINPADGSVRRKR